MNVLLHVIKLLFYYLQDKKKICQIEHSFIDKDVPFFSWTHVFG